MRTTKITHGQVAASLSWPAQHSDPDADRTIRLARCVAGPAAWWEPNVTVAARVHS